MYNIATCSYILVGVKKFREIVIFMRFKFENQTTTVIHVVMYLAN